MKKTHNNPFTPEQIQQLSSSKYVKSVSASTVRFNEEFKQHFVTRRNEGATSNQIFLECGIDPDVLGQKRIDGFRYMVKKQASREGGFADRNLSRISAPKNGSTEDESTDDRLKRLEHELAYTRQEVEFLKKIQMADMEARRQWESKHQPK